MRADTDQEGETRRVLQFCCIHSSRHAGPLRSTRVGHEKVGEVGIVGKMGEAW